MRYLARIGPREFTVEVVRRGRRHAVRVDGMERAVEVRGAGALLVVSVDGRRADVSVAREGMAGGKQERLYGVSMGGRFYPVRLSDPLRRTGNTTAGRRAGRVDVRAIMPGRITALLVKEGQEIRAGQGLIVVEAMKMENEIPAPADGRVTSVKVRPGEAVDAGAPLVTIE